MCRQCSRLLSSRLGSRSRRRDKPVITAVTLMHCTPLPCACTRAHVQAFCARGEEIVASCGRCHKPQDAERHLSPSPPTHVRSHAHVHARRLHVEAGTDINHWVGGAPGSSLQPADRKPDKRARTRMDRALDRALKKKAQPFVYGRACVEIISSPRQLSCGLTLAETFLWDLNT